MEELRDQRAYGAARHDDGTFCAKRSARTDRHSGGNRFKQRHPRRNARAAQQNGFNGLRHTVAADLFRAKARHHSDDESADDRYQYCPISEMMMRWRGKIETPALVIKQISEKPD